MSEIILWVMNKGIQYPLVIDLSLLRQQMTALAEKQLSEDECDGLLGLLEALYDICMPPGEAN